MTEPVESIEFSDSDREQLAALGVTTDDMPNFHPILEVWKKVLEPAKTERHVKITPQYANRMVHQYRGIDYADMGLFQEKFFDKMEAMEQILLDEIATDEDCLKPTTPQEDKEQNSQHYRNLLLNWQKQFLQWELDWTYDMEHAGLELGVISEIHNFFFSETGLTAHLQNIQFEYTEQDQAEVQAELRAMKEGGEDE